MNYFNGWKAGNRAGIMTGIQLAVYGGLILYGVVEGLRSLIGG